MVIVKMRWWWWWCLIWRIRRFVPDVKSVSVSWDRVGRLVGHPVVKSWGEFNFNFHRNQQTNKFKSTQIILKSTVTLQSSMDSNTDLYTYSTYTITRDCHATCHHSTHTHFSHIYRLHPSLCTQQLCCCCIDLTHEWYSNLLPTLISFTFSGKPCIFLELPQFSEASQPKQRLGNW